MTRCITMTIPFIYKKTTRSRNSIECGFPMSDPLNVLAGTENHISTARGILNLINRDTF